MARMIDADALVKETTESRCVNCDRRKGMKKGKMTFVYEIGDVPCRACDVMDMIDALEEAPTIGGWVSVKDRLPENGQFVVVRHEVKWRIYSEVAHYIMNLWWLDWDSNGLELNAISWMPLPEPPEEVSGDGQG